MSDNLPTMEDIMEASLKPCPRCGGKAVIDDPLKGSILCSECGFWSGEDYDDFDEARVWWDDQPLVDGLRARNAELEAQNARFEGRIAELVAAVALLEEAQERERIEGLDALMHNAPMYLSPSQCRMLAEEGYVLIRSKQGGQ